MWFLHCVSDDFNLWFSDGKDIHALRGLPNDSCRLIVNGVGFLDFTEVPGHAVPILDANGSLLHLSHDSDAPRSALDDKAYALALKLSLQDPDAFTLTLVGPEASDANASFPSLSVSGRLKPLPKVHPGDVDFINEMIEQKYIPYEVIPESPGKTMQEIEELGRRLFPFSLHSFQLALCVYDWTTASFTRMVFMKIFEYTGVLPAPYPIDQQSIAEQIWASDWPPYTPQDACYMKSFMMSPASSLADVKKQLGEVVGKLHQLSEIENRLFSAAVAALPRTSTYSKPQLFSGQVDISQLGRDHFGIELLECPLNNGPVGQSLITAFEDVLESYVSAGKVITTKMVWSFTDDVIEAIHYSNGILLVANPPDDSAVWERAACITPLSCDPRKTEYTFLPGTRFEVQSVDTNKINDKQIVVITLQPLPTRKMQMCGTARHAPLPRPSGLGPGEVLRQLESHVPPAEPPHDRHRAGGRRCDCNRLP